MLVTTWILAAGALHVCPASALPTAPDIVLPQGGDGNDVLTVAGERVYVDVCPASSLPPRLTLFSSAGRRRLRLVHGLLHRHHRGEL